VVVLRQAPGAGPGDAARRLTARYGGTVRRTWSTALAGFEARMNDKQARRLATDPAVAWVEQNRVVRASATQLDPPSYGLDRIDQRSLPLDRAYTFDRTAANVQAFVIDTGIRRSHVDFGGRAVSGFDAVDGGEADDCNGHGTHVAGTLGGARHGVAKGVRLVAVRVLDCAGTGDTAQLVAGIDFVAANAAGPAVANLSLGGEASPAVDAAAARAIAAGVTFVAASGNEGVDACGTSPGRVAAAVTVGATDRDDTRPDFSNFGRCVDIFAPGVDILSAGLDGDRATATLSGTSMAAPHVAGAAALLLSAQPNLTPQQVAARLAGNATPGVVLGPVGSPNRLLNVG
jgi:subtilisin family serine protease